MLVPLTVHDPPPTAVPLTVAFPYSAADAAWEGPGGHRLLSSRVLTPIRAPPAAASTLQLRSTSTPSSAGGDEAGGGNRGVEQDAEVGSGGGRPPLPPQGVQPLRQAHLQVHGTRRGRRLQRRRPGQ